jgi:serine protease Do
VNNDGRVIGINTAIVGDAYQGVSFAIPSSVAREVFERIRSDGQVRRGWLGVALDLVDDQRANDLGMPRTTGVYIVTVVDQPKSGSPAGGSPAGGSPGGGSPAARAGILAGDVILSWNDVEVANPATLSTLVARTAIGSRAKVVVFRDGKEIAMEVTVGQRPLD